MSADARQAYCSLVLDGLLSDYSAARTHDSNVVLMAQIAKEGDACDVAEHANSEHLEWFWFSLQPDKTVERPLAELSVRLVSRAVQNSTGFA